MFQRAGVGFCSRPRRVGIATLRNHLAFARARKRPAMVRAFLHATTMRSEMYCNSAGPCSLDAIPYATPLCLRDAPAQNAQSISAAVPLSGRCSCCRPCTGPSASSGSLVRMLPAVELAHQATVLVDAALRQRHQPVRAYVQKCVPLPGWVLPDHAAEKFMASRFETVVLTRAASQCCKEISGKQYNSANATRRCR